MNIILCGFMGCGKSTISKALAKKTQYNFIDLDEYIESKEKKSITNIFEEHGEKTFRKLETNAIKEIIKKDNYIISLGGGAVLNPENVEILKSNGKLFFLNISAQEVYNRLKDDTTRPLLQTDDKLSVIKNLLSQRLPVYNNVADYIIDVDGKDTNKIVKEIINFL